MRETSLLFLPGAGGSPTFWRPVADLLPAHWKRTFLGWPGLGHEAHDPAITGIDDLVQRAERALTVPSFVCAQSMGGIVAIQLALQRPDLVQGLVLSVTSGGIDLAPHATSDWRADYKRAYPCAADWIFTAQADHAANLHRIRVPVLLLWGDADPISPVSVGEALGRLFPNARLHIVKGGTHDLVVDRAAEVAPLVRAHVEATKLMGGLR